MNFYHAILQDRYIKVLGLPAIACSLGEISLVHTGSLLHSWSAFGKWKGYNDSAGAVHFLRLCNHWHKADLGPLLLHKDLQTAGGRGAPDRQLRVRKTDVRGDTELLQLGAPLGETVERVYLQVLYFHTWTLLRANWRLPLSLKVHMEYQHLRECWGTLPCGWGQEDHGRGARPTWVRVHSVAWGVPTLSAARRGLPSRRPVVMRCVKGFLFTVLRAWCNEHKPPRRHESVAITHQPFNHRA